MAGRRPKPTAVKQLAGNPGKRPLNVSEPKPPASSGRVPRGLGEEAAHIWRQCIPLMADLGIATRLDELAAQLMCEHLAIAQRAAKQLRDEDLLVDGRDGPKKNGLVQILRDHSMAAKSYMTEFGMTPASRSKIHPETGEQPSLLDEFFAKVLRPEGQPAEDPLSEMRSDG